MAGVRFTDVQARPTEFLDLTSITLDEFQQLVPPFETAFQAHMAAWRLDGKPRTARQFTVYKNCPLPTPEDRLFFLLTYLKTYALQVVQGCLFGMGQSKANQWIHVLLPALQAALYTLGDTRPAPSLHWRNGSVWRRLTSPPWSCRWRRTQPLNQRRLRIEHVNSSVKRCRIVKDRLRLWKEGVRDLVMELCCALHNFRVRLTPWQPMV